MKVILVPPLSEPQTPSLFQNWLNHLPVATSLWQLSANNDHPPLLRASNSRWQHETQNAATLEQLNNQLVFSDPPETLLTWWQTLAQKPLVASVALPASPANIKPHSLAFRKKIVITSHSV